MTYACAYCGKSFEGSGLEPSQMACCGEIGHVEPVDDEPEEEVTQ